MNEKSSDSMSLLIKELIEIKFKLDFLIQQLKMEYLIAKLEIQKQEEILK